MDGTLIEAWASLKSFRPKGERPEDRPAPDDPGNPTVNFHGERRSNATHASITDSDADTADFVADLRAEGITPHVAPNITTRRDSNLDWRTLRHEGYKLSQRCRKKVEEIFGWGKVIGGLRKTRYRGVHRTGFWAYLVGAAYDLLRMAKLIPEIAHA